MITFPNGTKASLSTTIAIGLFRSLIFVIFVAAFRSLAAWTWILGGVGMVYLMPAIEGYIVHPIFVAAGLMVRPGCVVHRKDDDG